MTFQMLRNRIGEDKFVEALRTVYQEMKRQIEAGAIGDRLWPWTEVTDADDTIQQVQRLEHLGRGRGEDDDTTRNERISAFDWVATAGRWIRATEAANETQCDPADVLAGHRFGDASLRRLANSMP